MLFVENTKRIVYISQSQGRWGVKCSDSRASNVKASFIVVNLVKTK